MDSFNEFPSLNFLHTFESAARNLSFTNAAKKLFVTQAAVSNQIKALKDFLGVKLFTGKNAKYFFQRRAKNFYRLWLVGYSELQTVWEIFAITMRKTR